MKLTHSQVRERTSRQPSRSSRTKAGRWSGPFEPRDAQSGEKGGADEEGRAVDRNHAAGTGAVLDDDRLAEALVEPLREHARSRIGRAACSEADQDAHGLDGIVLRCESGHGTE